MRDYNEEFKDLKDRKYAYDFDFEVMHKFMIRSFEPFFNKGNLLEMGSYKGDFTKRLIPYFDDITGLEAASEAIEISKSKYGDNVKYIHSTFEEFEANKRFNNIVLTHTLEHLSDPVQIMRKVNTWLDVGGRFFLVVPNARAPSRQIAVKMGLISHNCAVTDGESAHGHTITYSLDTLERDVRNSGLKIVYRTGIFFKALANFQFDKIMHETNAISDEYLEGCYQLGQQYPDMCSSLFFLCEKSD